MNGFGLFVVFGSLAAMVTLIVLGSVFPGPLAITARILGIVGCVAWVFAAIYLANAMNTDI